MSTGNAITARMGLDSSLYAQALAKVRALTASVHRELQGANNATAESVRRVGAAQSGHKGINAQAAGDMINLATSTSGACTEINTLTHLLGVPVAAGVGIAAGMKAVEAMAEAIDKVKEANAEARKELGKRSDLAIAAGPEAAKSASEAKAEAIKKLQDSRSTFSELSGMAAGFFRNSAILKGADKISNGLGFRTDLDKTLGDASKAHGDSLALQVQLEKQRLDIMLKSAAKIREETGLREHAVHTSAVELELEENRLALKEKIAKIQADPGNAGMRGALIEEAEHEAKIKADTIARAGAAKEREIKLERELTAIRKEGSRAEEATALAKLNASKAELDAGHDKESREAAQAKVDAAQLDYALAVRSTNELRAQLAAQKELADLIAPAPEKREAELESNRARLKERLINARPDERVKIEAELAVNDEQTRAFALAQTARLRDIAESQAQAGTGRGAGEAERALREKIGRARDNLTADRNNPLIDAAETERAAAALNDMEKSLADIAEARERSEAAARAEVQILSAQLAHEPILAAALRTELDFREKIRQANKDGNKELADQLTKQKALTLAAQAEQLVRKRAAQGEFSLQEIAERGHGKARSMAKRALEEQRKGEEEALKGNQAGALRHFDRANRIRRRIGPLNFEDKNAARDLLPGAVDGIPKAGRMADVAQGMQTPAAQMGASLKAAFGPTEGKLDAILKSVEAWSLEMKA